MANRPIDIFKKINMHDGDRTVCWEWLGVIDKSRPYFVIKGKKLLVYRVMFDIMNENVLQSDEVIRHSCDNPICCNPMHLNRGSQQDNMNDMKERARHGLPHHSVRNIKKLLAEGKQTHQEIADLYGTTRENITAINTGRSYSHVKEEEDNVNE